MKDVYDHLNHRWLDFEPTERWMEHREFKNAIKGILAAIVVSICMGIMSLGTIILLWWVTIPHTDRARVTLVSYNTSGIYSAINSHSGNEYPTDYIEQMLDFAIERGSKIINL